MNTPEELQQLAFALKMNGGRSSFNFDNCAIEAFKFFFYLSKKRVIDEDYLRAVLTDAEVIDL